MLRIILNGKKAGIEEVRSSITNLRGKDTAIEVRVTYEQGDVDRLVNEAVRDGVVRIVAAGGDGTVNEVVNALARVSPGSRPEVAVLPLGTANDFASACEIPLAPGEALELAVQGNAVPVDVGQANDRHFINAATGGFGAMITAETPTPLKNFLGGGAYTIMGVLRAIDFSPYKGSLKGPDFDIEGEIAIAAVCNNRRAGHGQPLAPRAYINDGLLDVLIVRHFPLTNATQVLTEYQNQAGDGTYVQRFQFSEAIATADRAMPLNLDGEPYENNRIAFKVLPGAIRMVLPEGCPCLC